MKNLKLDYNLLQALKQVGDKKICYGSDEEYVFQNALWLYDEKKGTKEKFNIADKECLGFVCMAIFNQLVKDTPQNIYINKEIHILLEKNKKFYQELENLEKKFKEKPYIASEKEYIIVKDENLTRFFMAEILIEDSKEYGIYINPEDSSHPMFHGIDLFDTRQTGSVKKTNVIERFKESEKENVIKKLSDLKITLSDIEKETNDKINKLKNEIKELKHKNRIKKTNAINDMSSLQKDEIQSPNMKI